jgi:hypothetical protein
MFLSFILRIIWLARRAFWRGDVKMIVNSSGVKDSWNDYYPFGMQMGI